MLAFRNRRLCGLAELRFDGRPVAHRLASYVGGPANAGWMELFLTMDVPLSAAPGPHTLQLYGPVLGGRRKRCARTSRHQGQRSATLVVASKGLPSAASRND